MGYMAATGGRGRGMTGTEWLVLAACAAAIGWVNWYFFVAGRTRRPAAKTDGPGA